MFQQLTALCEAREVTVLEACQSANPSPQPNTHTSPFASPSNNEEICHDLAMYFL
uniref:Uncharacterized protein n=1 Tax=Brassica oleracea var. oleracea TaxID=109376 RepID=A0A0D3CU77_BRAOL